MSRRHFHRPRIGRRRSDSNYTFMNGRLSSRWENVTGGDAGATRGRQRGVSRLHRRPRRRAGTDGPVTLGARRVPGTCRTAPYIHRWTGSTEGRISPLSALELHRTKAPACQDSRPHRPVSKLRCNRRWRDRGRFRCVDAAGELPGKRLLPGIGVIIAAKTGWPATKLLCSVSASQGYDEIVVDQSSRDHPYTEISDQLSFLDRRVGANKAVPR